MSSSLADIRSLLALINSAAEDAIQQYQSSGCGIPSLNATTPPKHPQNDTILRKSLRILESACHQLCATLVPPDLTMYTRTYGYIDTACMRVISNAKIADIIPDDADGLPIEEIARKANLEPKKLSRIMRFLSATHCFREVKPGIFANNALSMTLRHEHPMSALSSVGLNVINPHGAAYLYDTLSDPDPHYSHSSTVTGSPFSYGIRHEMRDGTFFTWLSKNREFGALFNRALGMLYSVTDAPAAIREFPWGTLPHGTTVCDFGSGIGTVGLELAKVHTNLHLTLQDLPDIIEQAEKFWNTKYSEIAADHQRVRVAFVPFDFFKEPPVEGQDIYFIRQIIHNWNDESCVKILKNVRCAMKPSSRILIHEFILRPNVDAASGDRLEMEKAPEPLLPNYGFGCTRTYLQDVLMLILLNAKERTLVEIQAIGAQAGLRFVKVWEFLDTGLVEFEVDMDTDVWM